MAEIYDVASRLAQGRPAVDTVQQYVWASHQLGYHHQGLTLHPSQVRDWYGTEDGMDLDALHRGWLALDAATRAAHEALDVQDRQSAPLSAGWQGAGGHAARDFLRRHGDASAAVAAAVRTAAEAVAALREHLWQAVGAKVDTAVAVEARAAGARVEWLAAATTVTTGAGDRSAASELVDTAVKPFVDNHIRGDWLVGMQTAVGEVTAAYERALREIEGEPSAVFGVPGDFGPACGADQASTTVACASPKGGPAATAPSAWSASAVPAPAVPAPAAAPPPAPAPPMPAPLPLSEPVAPAAPSPLGAMGSAMPDMGGGLAGLGQQFADTLSGLLGGAEGGIPDLPDADLDEPNPDEDLAVEDDGSDEDGEGDDDEDLTDEDLTDDALSVEEAGVEEVAVDPETELEQGPCEPGDPAAPAATPAPAPAPQPPPPAEPLLPPAGPAAAERTPCEIAADEVPQVGAPAE